MYPPTSLLLVMKDRILIIPDVHGRKFWRRAYERFAFSCNKIIFLGDYLDPYDEFDYDIVGELRDIIITKRDNPRKVILLLGNHDLHYIYGDFTKGSRYQYIGSRRITKIFKDNIKLFKLAYQVTFRDTTYLFTHAGITRHWLGQNELTLPTDKPIAEWLEHYVPIEYYNQVGRDRGGYAPSGSPIWADIDEHWPYEPIAPNVYQVFGHTLSPWRLWPANKHMACLDCAHAFIMTGAGVFGLIDEVTI